MVQLQRAYDKHQPKGQAGQIARPAFAHNIDQGVVGVEVKPGYGVLYDDTTHKWLLPTSAAERLLVTHVVRYTPAATNTDIAVPTGNNSTEVVYAADTLVELAAFGNFLVYAGESLENEDPVVFNESTGKWIKYAPASPTANDIRKVPFKAYVKPLSSVADGVLFELSIPSWNYSFESMAELDVATNTADIATNAADIVTNAADIATNVSAIDALELTQLQMAKVSLTATEIKNLVATPIEIVAAPGAGLLLDFVSARLELVAGTNVLTEAADNLVLEYDGGSGVVASEVVECTGFIDQAVDTVTNMMQVKDVIAASSAAVNKNLALVNTNAEFAGNAANDAALDVYIVYRIIDVS